VALHDAIQSASIIEERASGLVQFIERYKKLTGLPPMKTRTFSRGRTDLQNRTTFQAKSFRIRGSVFSFPQKCTIELEADRQMLEQVLINLVRNSVDALQNTNSPEIEISCYPEGDKHISPFSP
jgi:two-component system nitrogen regulation sensor histidine kinase NtrY